VVLAKFINCAMYGGKKAVAEAIVYSALEQFSSKAGVNPVDGFEKVISSVRPMIEVRSKRVGGATYQVPMEVSAERGVAMSIRWIIKSARARSGKSMSDKLIGEFFDAYNGKGASVKRRDDMHKMAEANRAFVHYRW